MKKEQWRTIEYEFTDEDRARAWKEGWDAYEQAHRKPLEARTATIFAGLRHTPWWVWVLLFAGLYMFAAGVRYAIIQPVNASLWGAITWS